ncbi:hypothetical protein J3D55_001795 [Chryseobacterium ginsenosidimutans]|uniref:GEVED domain-containing protein n=1 Tax=Chryseobacterium ginsenosidimutans TaxID=687846 RepID=UPI0021687161|nr:GEVED domain-containing protein [Chryseobacterium ginsenosidimutans]MCS3868879.1 hypothetical protein [Chryseobacterium ginsenosidimutans]
MKKLLLACMMALGIGASAQISYTYGWDSSGLGSWTTTGSGTFSRSTTTPCNGAGSVRANNYYAASSYLVSPALTGTNGGDLTVGFSYKVTQYSANTTGAASADFGVINLQWSTSASGPWTNAYTIDSSTHVVSASCATKTATISGLPASGNVYLRLEAKSGLSTSDNYVYFDDVTVSQGAAPSCLPPSVPTASNITLASADVSWMAPTSVPGSGYEYYLSTSNTSPTSATPATGTSAATTKSLSGLTGNTLYYIWVRSVCSTTDKSAWSQAGSFVTGYCLPTGGTGSTSYYLKTISTTGALTNLSYSANSYLAYVNNSATTFSSYPGGTFNYSLANSNSSTCYFYIWVDWNNDLDFEDAGEAILATTTYSATNSGTITIPAGQALGSYRVRIGESESGAITSCGPSAYGNYVDYTLSIVAAPTCIAPSAGTIANITTSGADVSWTAPATAPANGYDLYYSTSSTAPTSTSTPNYANISGTTKTLSGLTSSTSYYVWIRSSCTATDKSAWAGPYLFSTSITNDNCGSPVPLTIGASFASNAIVATNIGSTIDETPLSCQTNANNNVWYSVVVPPSGNLTIETKAVAGSTYTDSVINAFSGSCGALTGVGCDDDSGDDAFSKLVLTGQTPGATLLVSVWRWSNSSVFDGQFQVSAYDSSLLATNEVKDAKNNIKVYPNPFSDVITISDIKNVKNVFVSDISGRLVKTIANPSSSLQLGELKQGMYLLTLEMKDGSKQTIKTIKK